MELPQEVSLDLVNLPEVIEIVIARVSMIGRLGGAIHRVD